MLTTTIQVALGGAIGAALRYLCGLAILRIAGGGFPLGVLSVNVIGSFVMGCLVIWSSHRGMGHLNAFLMTGILGGFTTFSAFSLETFVLMEKGQFGQAAAYVLLSVGLSIGALLAGVAVTRGALT